MKVKSSEYLAKVKPLLVCLRDRLLQEYPYVSVLATDSKAMSYRVSKNGTSISTHDLLSGRGFVVKVYDGSSYAEYSFNDISEDNLEELISNIREAVVPLAENLPEGVKKSA